jgi:hypothetical protein
MRPVLGSLVCFTETLISRQMALASLHVAF